ncbi:hypothetical protein BX600DRAFT_441428 [Xylariales sp. PMI_506]|nr:hypothetical protein BX600DRAFT_441428 [Xylariales sp. PMI_506]
MSYNPRFHHHLRATDFVIRSFEYLVSYQTSLILFSADSEASFAVVQSNAEGSFERTAAQSLPIECVKDIKAKEDPKKDHQAMMNTGAFDYSAGASASSEPNPQSAPNEPAVTRQPIPSKRTETLSRQTTESSSQDFPAQIMYQEPSTAARN